MEKPFLFHPAEYLKRPEPKTIGTFVILQPFNGANGITMKRRDYSFFFFLTIILSIVILFYSVCYLLLCFFSFE